MQKRREGWEVEVIRETGESKMERGKWCGEISQWHGGYWWLLVNINVLKWLCSLDDLPPLSSLVHKVDISVISHLSPFIPFSVRFIRPMNVNENILNVGFQKRLNFHIWVHSVHHGSSMCINRSPAGEEGRKWKISRVHFKLSQTINLARVEDNYICILRGRNFPLLSALSVFLPKFWIYWSDGPNCDTLIPDSLTWMWNSCNRHLMTIWE